MSVNTQAKRARRARRQSNSDRFGQAPRIEIVADDATLTPYGGSAVVGELVRRLQLIPALDQAIETAPRVGGLGPVKQRARGCSPGQLLMTVAESMLCGGDSMLDLERLRADAAGAKLRAVAALGWYRHGQEKVGAKHAPIQPSHSRTCTTTDSPPDSNASRQ